MLVVMSLDPMAYYILCYIFLIAIEKSIEKLESIFHKIFTKTQVTYNLR